MDVIGALDAGTGVREMGLDQGFYGCWGHAVRRRGT
jgi:hypothetical protein